MARCGGKSYCTTFLEYTVGIGWNPVELDWVIRCTRDSSLETWLQRCVAVGICFGASTSCAQKKKKRIADTFSFRTAWRLELWASSKEKSLRTCYFPKQLHYPRLSLTWFFFPVIFYYSGCSWQTSPKEAKQSLFESTFSPTALHSATSFSWEIAGFKFSWPFGSFQGTALWILRCNS